LSIRYSNVPNFHWIAGPTIRENVISDTIQFLDLVAKMPVRKLAPIIGNNFPHSLSFQMVDGRTVERSKVMNLAAITTVKKLIMNHGLFPQTLLPYAPKNDNRSRISVTARVFLLSSSFSSIASV
jgi:ligand-binding SRPBCC domain-containing protein